MKKKPKTKNQKLKTKRAVCEQILCAGFGGQGIMFMGKLLAQAAFLSGKQTTWMPSYGAEVRGGTAYSMTKISDGEVASPIVTDPDILIVMNRPSFVKYEPKLKIGGILIANKSLVGNITCRKGIKLINIPMTDISSKLGSAKIANMIAIGIFAKRSKMISLKNIIAALKEILKDKEELFLLNKKALEKGYGRG